MNKRIKLLWWFIKHNWKVILSTIFAVRFLFYLFLTKDWNVWKIVIAVIMFVCAAPLSKLYCQKDVTSEELQELDSIYDSVE